MAKAIKSNFLHLLTIILLAVIVGLLVLLISNLNSSNSKQVTSESPNPSVSAETSNSDKPSFLQRVESMSKEELLSINPKDVYTFTCEIVEQKPTEQTVTCADFGITVHSIKWDTWEASGASGQGIYSVLNCEPSCADGTRNEVPVEVKLSGLKTDGSKYYLTYLNAYSLDGKPLELSHMFPWDLADFYLYFVKNEQAD